MAKYVSTDHHAHDDDVHWFETSDGTYGVTDGFISGEIKILDSDGVPLARVDTDRAVVLGGGPWYLIRVWHEIKSCVNEIPTPPTSGWSDAHERAWERAHGL